jgi:hypothetical protein
VTEAERERRFKAELARQARRLPRIQAATVREVLRTLRDARARVTAQIAEAGSLERRERLEQLRAEIDRVMAGFAREAGATMAAGATTAWRAGIELTTAPLAAAGADSIATTITPRINPRVLTAMRSFLTDRIADVSRKSVDRVNRVLGRVLVGELATSDAITEVQRILGGAARQRAATITYTELGRAYAIAAQAAMEQTSRRIPMRKRWLRSGKLHPRPEHVRAHNQIVHVDEPFDVGGEKLMHPRDPAGSPENTINCGCISVPVVDGSSFGASVVSIDGDAARLVSAAERRRQNQQSIDEANAVLAALGIAERLPGLRVTTDQRPATDAAADDP